VIDPQSHDGDDLFKRRIALGFAIRKAASRRPPIRLLLCLFRRPPAFSASSIAREVAAILVGVVERELPWAAAGLKLSE
jgi:hypothetical protein